MALIRVHFNSTVFNMGTSLSVILPQYAAAPNRGGTSHKGPYRTLYLLHGMGGDCTEWLRNTSLERYAGAYSLAIVMPNGDNSFYSDLENGMSYQNFLTGELIEKCEQWFPLSQNPEDRFIGGISMGGYGALRTALTHPGLYGRVFGISSVTEILPLYEKVGFEDRAKMLFGPKETAIESGAELYAQLRRLHGARETLPKVCLIGGLSDPLCPQSERMAEALRDAGGSVRLHRSEGGHDWAFGDRAIVDALAWLFEKEEKSYGAF